MSDPTYPDCGRDLGRSIPSWNGLVKTRISSSTDSPLHFVGPTRTLLLIWLLFTSTRCGIQAVRVHDEHVHTRTHFGTVSHRRKIVTTRTYELIVVNLRIIL